jgi:leucyl/phenylalanyl-tRNA--protein transferase
MHPDLQPDLLLSAYASGIFPMADEDGEIYWYSPDPRAVIELDAFHVTRSLRKVIARRRYDISVDTAFAAVMQACADRAEGTWISADIVDAYCRLHALGYAHSVEARREGRLVGGLYGVALRGAFFGESMFFRETDASKVALAFLVERMQQRGFVLLDVQFMTEHLRQFGACEIPRQDYLRRLGQALTVSCSFVDRPDGER